MKTNQLLAFGLLGAAGWLWFKNKSQPAGPDIPRNAFGAPLDAVKPSQFGFNTSRLSPTGARQATNATANPKAIANPESGSGVSVDLLKLGKSLWDLLSGRNRDPKLNPTQGAPGGTSFDGTALNENPSASDMAFSSFDSDADSSAGAPGEAQSFQDNTVRDFGID